MMNAKKNVKNAETEKTKVSAVKSNKNEKEKGDWHRLAAKKAWITIRSRRKKEVSGNGKVSVKAEKADDFEVSEEDVNGVGLEKLQKDMHKHQQKKADIEKAMSAGKTREVRSVEVGKIIKSAKLDRTGNAVKIICVK